MKIRLLVLALSVFGITSTSHAADKREPLIPLPAEGTPERSEVRLKNQHTRIMRGIKDGKLTRKEANTLLDAQKKLAERIAAAKADGNFSADEMADIERRQIAASARIYLQKHDKQATDERKRAQVRNIKQERRVDAGLEDGSLTPEEAQELDKYIAKNRELFRKLSEDGLTKDERARLEAKQDLLSAQINIRRNNDKKVDTAVATAK